MEDRGPGNGDRFIVKLDAILQHLRRHPAMAPVFEPPVRRLVVDNTGFGVFYTVEDRGIIIHVLVHLSQNPESIRARILRMLGW